MGATQKKLSRSRHQPTGCWIRPASRLAIYLRDGLRCQYCGRDLHGAAPDAITLDHLRPRSAGGTNDAANLVTACRSCNSSRQDQPWTQYATGGAVIRIRRTIRRRIARYRTLARAIIAGEITTKQARAEGAR